MNKWERGVTKFLNETERRFLKEYDRWIHSVFAHIPWGADEHTIHNFILPTVQRLSNILFKNVHEVFTSGQAHGSADCKDVLKKYKRKFASIPGISMEQALKGDEFVPYDAIQALKKRSIVLAGDVETDITKGIKQILLNHLTGLARKDAEAQIANLLEKNMNRASLIVTTETTYAYNRGRLFSYKEFGADYVQYSAIMDQRTCAICSSRHGKIMKLTEIGENTPPVHGRCRCVLSPVYSDVQSNLLTDNALDWSNVKSLPKGWVN